LFLPSLGKALSQNFFFTFYEKLLEALRSQAQEKRRFDIMVHITALKVYRSSLQNAIPF